MKKFSTIQLSDVKSKLTALPDEKSTAVMSLRFRNTTTVLIISIFLGVLGIDRFLVGRVGIGILKLLTGGCCGVMWIIDIFNHKKLTHEYNYKKFIEAIALL